MTDWKSALAALGASEQVENVDTQSEVNRRKRVGVVYSTNSAYEYSEDDETEVETLPKCQQRLRLAMERAGRGGKTVTLVKGFVGSADDLKQLGKLLKQKCGVGGAVKDGYILIQGDYRARLLELLVNEGYTQTK